MKVRAMVLLFGIIPRFCLGYDRSCHPVFNEISTLGFKSSYVTQFIELSLSEGCKDSSSRKSFTLNKYGLLVLETRPLLNLHLEPDTFSLISFVDFNNHKWPQEDGHFVKRFYVVGSSRENVLTDFRFYDFDDRTASTTVEYQDFVSKFSFVKTSSAGNPSYVTDKIQVSRSDQEWLSSRIKSHVVFAPTEDTRSMLSLGRLATLLPGQTHFYVLPPDSLDDCTSASYCDSTWVLALPSPGERNYCTGENVRLHLSRVEVSHTTQQPSVDEVSPMDASSYSDSQDELRERPGGYAEPLDASVEGGNVDHPEVRDQCHSQVTELKLTIKALNKQVEDMKEELHRLVEEMKEKNNFFKEAFQLTGESERRRYGLFRSKEDLEKLKQNLHYLSVDGKTLSRSQITTLAKLPWLSYYRNPTKPYADFLRCNLCNRETVIQEYDPDPDHAKCEQSIRRNDGKLRTNALGRGSVMCVQKYGGRDPSSRKGINVILNRVRAHQSTSEHEANFQEYIATAKALETRVPQVVEGSLIYSCRLHYCKRRAIFQEAIFPYAIWDYAQEQHQPQHTLIPCQHGTISQQNRPITFHFALVRVESERADDIVDALTSYLEDLESWKNSPGLNDTPYAFFMKRMVALSSDGASVMTGASGGVHRKLQGLIIQETQRSGSGRVNFLLSVCAAHKLDLAVKGQKGSVFKFTQVLVSELHSLFTSARGRAAYSAAAKDMGFPLLKMDALHASSISKLLRVYPVLIQASERLAKDSSASPIAKERATDAEFILNDGRIFITLHHVNATLSYLARLSEALQDEEALMVDYLSRWRHLDSLLEHEALKDDVYDYLAHCGFLYMWDHERHKFVDADLNFLKNYYTPYSTPHSTAVDGPSENFLAYNPSMFSDFSLKEVDKLEELHRMNTAHLRRIQFFRNVNTGYSPGEQGSTDLRRYYLDITVLPKPEAQINQFYNDLRTSFRHHMTPSKYPTEAHKYFPYALDRHIILDIIECNGDYEAFKNCDLPGVTAASRGYPEYVDEEGNVDKGKRDRLILMSITDIQENCSLPEARGPFFDFYNSIARTARTSNTWPTDLRSDKNSIQLYKTLLDNGEALKIPPPLVHQWTKPRPGLKLKPHLPLALPQLRGRMINTSSWIFMPHIQCRYKDQVKVKPPTRNISQKKTKKCQEQ
ncbi:hypothetical protein OSTOST_14817 [Ostertagia ostertagi]